MDQVYKTFDGNTESVEQSGRQTRKQASKQASRKTFKQSIAYRTFNDSIKYFFADENELDSFDVLRDVRTVELVAFLSVLGMGVFGTLFFGTLVVLGMFS